MNADNNVLDAEYEILDDDLKMILRDRYEDASHLFTREAQDKRRNNRLIFTGKIALFMAVVCGFMAWANAMGMMSIWKMILGMISCSLVVGYNIGVCVCHNKGWRGA